MLGVPLRQAGVEAAVPGLPDARRHLDDRHSLERTRAGLPRIVFLPPDHTPSMQALARSRSEDVRRCCSAALDLSPEAVAAAISALTDASRGVSSKSRRSIDMMIAADAVSDCDSHDVFFNIKRTSKPKPVFYLRSAFETLIAFRQDLAETPITIGEPALSRIETGLLTMMSSALGEGPRRSRGLFATASATCFEDYAARRWIRGHQIFAALSQGLIFAMERLGTARAGGRAQKDAVVDFVTGLDACASALEFTGDFPDQIYDEQIRPSMCPPHMPRGFSGLLSADHAHLVRRMKVMKPALDALRAGQPDDHRAIVTAMGHVYDSHKHVCAKFVGTDRSSLLMTGGTTRSSVEQLDRFKTMRIRNLG